MKGQEKRKIISYEPSGVAAQMIALEERGMGYGAKTRILEQAVVTHLGPKYPKLMERWKVDNGFSIK